MNRKTFTTALVVPAALLALGLSGLPGCTDDGADELNDTVAALRADMQRAGKDRTRLEQKIDRMERRLAGYAQDIDRLQHDGLTAMKHGAVAEPGEEDGAAAGPADEDVTATTDRAGLAKLLQTEDGRAAMETAMQAIQERRDRDRRDRMVQGMVDRFAEQADLTPEQSSQVKRLMGDRFNKIREIWSSMRNAGDMGPEERSALRDDNMAKMEEIRLETDAEVKSILSVDQYALYEEQSARMGGGFRGGTQGGRTRGGGGGGFRGR